MNASDLMNVVLFVWISVLGWELWWMPDMDGAI